MGIQAQLPTIFTVVTAAAIDAVNPCAIGVLILMISVVLTSGGSIRRLLWLGFLYVLSVFFVYLSAGLGIVYFFNFIPLAVAEYLSIFVAIIIIFAGIVEIKDYFWYGQGFSLAIPSVFVKKIHVLTQNLTSAGVIFLGAFVSAVELPCTGAPYLAIITILSQYFDFTAFLLLIAYNIIFVSPLIVILLLVGSGMQMQKIKMWKHGARAYMRLFIGILLVILGWMLILIANGEINLG